MITEINILSSLLNNPEYTAKVLPFIKEAYFTNDAYKLLFKQIYRYIDKYSAVPTTGILAIEIANIPAVSEATMKQLEGVLNSLTAEVFPLPWLLEFTESWCKQAAVYNALLKAIEIHEDSSKIPISSIPDLLQDALSVSFDNSVGIDYLKSADDRHDFFNKVEENKIPLNLDIFNKITKKGFAPKSLNLVLGSSGTGKSIFLTNYAASSLSYGKNVLFITLEMSAENIAQRIDANLLDVNINDLYSKDKSNFVDSITKLQSKTNGELYIKEYPIATSHAGHFKILLNDLKIKKKFIPDVIIIDYLNICASSRVAPGSPAYVVVKSIAEELRALAVECNVPLVSAIQLNRSGVNNNEPDMSNIADSYGIALTADFIAALVSTPELQQLNQLLCVQVKNRYNALDYYKKFLVGLDKSKMKFYDLEESAQEKNITKDTIVTTPEDDVLNQFKLTKTSKVLNF